MKNFLIQLKYLFKTSFKIINEFGIKYFLNFGLGQLKNQKLELFKTHNEILDSIKIEPKLEPKEQYELWKQKHKKSLLVDDELKFSPVIHVFMIIDKNSSQKSIESSINSIQHQNYPNWKLSIFTCDEQIFNFVEHSVEFDSENKIFTHFLKNYEFPKIFIDFPIVEEYVFFLSGNVILERSALYQIVKSLNHDLFDILYSDEERLDLRTNQIKPFFKPDWSSYLFSSFNFIGNSFLISKRILEKINHVNGLDVGDFFDLLIQATKISNKIHHISSVLFQDILKPVDLSLHKELISNSLKMENIDATADIDSKLNLIKINYNLNFNPKVSIIIPTKDNKDLLFKCIQSLEYNTNYENFEIIIVDNNSQNNETKDYLSSLPYTVINYDDEFNFSKMNNLAVSKASGDYLLFLNDDTESINPNWLQEMVSVCNQKDVGIVGAKLLYNNNTIQHAGMVFLKTGYFFHPFQNKPSNSDYFFEFINRLRETSSVTGACLLIKKNLFNEIGKFDDVFDVYYGDSDLCFKVRKYGLKVIYNPYALLRHDGSSKIREMTKIFVPVENYLDFFEKWPSIKNGDPFYNTNFSLDYNIEYD